VPGHEEKARRAPAADAYRAPGRAASY